MDEREVIAAATAFRAAEAAVDDALRREREALAAVKTAREELEAAKDGVGLAGDRLLRACRANEPVSAEPVSEPVIAGNVIVGNTVQGIGIEERG